MSGIEVATVPLLILVALVAWWIFGSPAKNVADWIWDDDAAPWEAVDAYYYPNGSDLTVWRAMPGLSSVADCRTWVRGEASWNGDAGFIRGDYECAVGKLDDFAGLPVYRATVR